MQLANEGVLIRNKNSKYDVADNIQRFINYKSGTDGDESLDAERTKHEKFKSRLTELRLAKKELRMHDAKDIELVMTEMLTNLRTQLLGLPSQLSGVLANQSQESIYEIMTREIESKLLELANYTPELFAGDDDEEDD